MTEPVPPADRSARVRNLNRAGVAATIAGLLLFVYFVRETGFSEIAAGIRNIGWAFIAILVLAGYRLAVRALAWTWCVEGPVTLRFRDAFTACLTGDALGNLTPLGLVVSEPAKAAFVRKRIPLMPAFAALAVENLLYSLTAVAVIFLGTIALLLSFRLPQGLHMVTIATLVASIALLAAVYVAIRKELKILSGTLAWLQRRGLGTTRLHARLHPLQALEERIYGFAGRNRGRVVWLIALECSFHLAGFAETYLAVLLIGGVAPTLLTAFILESVNRAITVAFKFVPLRLGVDEAGTGLLAGVLGLGTTLGVTLAIVRKARVLCWTAVGVALLARRGLSVREVIEDPELRLRQPVAIDE